ncbi:MULTISPECIES: M14 family metallopeptidase [unclassified Pseudoalteromonas]|uniref:M14 family metallopeptidase n=1 Tax=unclassified Pseudoalteromonas TaxID=194690 RepID=UPI0020971924|nr:M14 family metallopeptidase [Pseudoalteromonas sp. XMcav2-N]MCO7191183.1 M14 family metallopeptidase [Pseudoalteromonas sp. XMcav2-N]
MNLGIVLLSATVNLNSHLPPLQDWQGKSVSLMQEQGPLTTDFELSKGLESPDYAKTMAFVDRLVAANPTQFKAVTIGKSDAGRDIKMLVASQVNQFSPAMLKNNNKPTLLIQAGIHAGEIDGKDAMFMLLRDIATGKRRDILNKVNILFIPILNVDGHERRSVYNRINQRGPKEMGYRTNGLNLNLNRDYTKLDTPGVRAVMNVINQYQPAMYLDLHVTDGADYQYDITYGFNPSFASESPAVAKVLEQHFTPMIDEKLRQQGHEPGQLVFVMDKRDFKQGLAGWVASPRFSNGWADIKALPSILLENHSLKPYKQRVLGTYVFVDGVIDALTEHQQALAKAVETEKHFVPDELVVERGYSEKPDLITFKGISYKRFESALSGQMEAKYLGKPEFYEQLPVYWQKVEKRKVKVPSAFYIPPAYTGTVDKLKLHGIAVEQLNTDVLADELVQFSITSYEFAKSPFEGRFRVSAQFEQQAVSSSLSLSGWYKVSTQQAGGELATHLLHPEAPDSLFVWGDFPGVFQRTEYVENYALEPFARKMLKDNPAMALAFDKKISEDKAFAGDPKARMEWLYKRTPYYDQAYLKYPILMSFKEK